MTTTTWDLDLAAPASWVDIARERSEAYDAGPSDAGSGTAATPGAAAATGASEAPGAALGSSDPEALGLALSRLPSEDLARVLGATVSNLSGDGGASALRVAALHLEDAAAVQLCAELAGAWSSEALLSAMDATVDALSSRGLGPSVDDAALHDSLGALYRLERRVVAERYRRLREVQSRGSHVTEGARTLVDLLLRFGLTRGKAREEVETAKALADLPKTQEAFAKGKLDASKAAEAGRALGECKRPRPDAPDRDAAEGDAEAERLDIDDAAASAPEDEDRHQLRKRLEAQQAKRSKDRLADKERRAFRRRHARKFKDGDGASIQIYGPGAAVMKLWEVVEALAGRASTDDDRTLEQRRFDAAMHIADRYLAEGKLPQVGEQRSAVLLIAGEDALHDVESAEPPIVDGFGPVSSETARMLCCDAVMTTVVMGEDGQPLRVGRAQYRPSRAQRRAVVARDRSCVGCGADARRCEVHHIVWWRHGGPTDIENLVLVCWSCHTHIHQHGWVVVRDAAGRYRAGPPERFTAGEPIMARGGLTGRDHPPGGEGDWSGRERHRR